MWSPLFFSSLCDKNADVSVTDSKIRAFLFASSSSPAELGSRFVHAERMSQAVEKTADGVVVLKYADLVAKKNLAQSIEEGFGYHGIGLLIVSGVPEFPKFREALLPLATRFAELPEEKMNKVVHKESSYSFGWSHGKEILTPGKFGTPFPREKFC